jgi:hypothetical protein
MQVVTAVVINAYGALAIATDIGRPRMLQQAADASAD